MSGGSGSGGGTPGVGGGASDGGVTSDVYPNDICDLNADPADPNNAATVLVAYPANWRNGGPATPTQINKGLLANPPQAVISPDPLPGDVAGGWWWNCYPPAELPPPPPAGPKSFDVSQYIDPANGTLTATINGLPADHILAGDTVDVSASGGLQTIRLHKATPVPPQYGFGYTLTLKWKRFWKEDWLWEHPPHGAEPAQSTTSTGPIHREQIQSHVYPHVSGTNGVPPDFSIEMYRTRVAICYIHLETVLPGAAIGSQPTRTTAQLPCTTPAGNGKTRPAPPVTQWFTEHPVPRRNVSQIESVGQNF